MTGTARTWRTTIRPPGDRTRTWAVQLHEERELTGRLHLHHAEGARAHASRGGHCPVRGCAAIKRLVLGLGCNLRPASRLSPGSARSPKRRKQFRCTRALTPFRGKGSHEQTSLGGEFESSRLPESQLSCCRQNDKPRSTPRSLVSFLVPHARPLSSTGFHKGLALSFGSSDD